MDRPEKNKKGDKDGKGPFSFMSLRGKSPKQTRPTEVKGPIAEHSSQAPKQAERTTEPGTSLQAPKMSSLCLSCVIEDEDIVFLVDVPAQARVTVLKKEIQRERAMDTLQGVGPHMLELWKVCVLNE